MNRVIILFSFLMLFMGNISSSEINYDKLWTKVHEEKSSNPRTSLSIVNDIEAHAKMEGDKVQLLCALLYKIDINGIVNDSSIFSGVSLLEQYYQNEDDVAIKAFAALSLSKLYDAYYHNNIRKIRAVTAVSGEKRDLPLDEWDSQMFEDTIRILKERTMERADDLKLCLSNKYSPMLNLGADSRIYQPTLFDFFSYQLVDFSKSIEEQNRYLQGVMDFHASDKEPSAYIYAKLKWLKNQRGNEMGSEAYHNSLKDLLAKYKNSSASLLIRADWAASLLDCRNRNCRTVDFDPSTPQKILTICQEGIDDFPNDSRTKVLRAIQGQVKEQSLSVEVRQPRVHSGDKVKLHLHYANVENVEITMYRCNDISETSLLLPYQNLSYSKKDSWKFPLKKSNYYIPLDTIIELPAQEYGLYYLDITPRGKDKNSFVYFVVSDLYELNTSLKENSLCGEFIVMDSRSGEPLESVALRLFKNQGKTFLSQYLSDRQGVASYCVPSRGSYSFLLKRGEDRYYGDISRYFHSNREELESPVHQYVSILTDRSIYRFGDKLSFKCIAYQLGEAGREVLPNKSVKVTLYDANHQVVLEKELVTSALGSAWADIQLPESGLPGYYSLQTERGSTSFRVDSYKRPTFEVTLSKPQKDYAWGDSILVSGVAKYLIGLPLNGAKVKYKVERKMMRYPIFVFDEAEAFEVGGEVQADENGNFDISFLANKVEGMKHLYYNYEIEVDVTDKGGETRSAKIVVPIGEKSLLFVFKHPERLLFDSLNQVKINLKNLDGVGLQKEVSYKVSFEKDWIFEGLLQTDSNGEAALDIATDTWKSGKYLFQFSTCDHKGGVVEDSFEVVLYREKESRPPVFSEIWIHNEVPKEMSWGDAFHLEVGTSYSEAHLLCIIEDEHKIVEKRWYSLSNEIKSIPINFEKENGKGLKIDLYLIRDGVSHHETFMISKRVPAYDIPIQVKTFRDRLSPNMEEEWELQLPIGGDSAEVLVAMYDASLDMLSKHSWNVTTHYPWRVSYNHWNGDYFSAPSSMYWNSQTSGYSLDFKMDRLNDVTNFNGLRRMMDYGMVTFTSVRGATMKSAPQLNAMSRKMVADAAEMVTEESAEEESVSLESGATGSANKEFEYRKDFSPTAFFYPNLKPNEDGVVTIKFKSPETLTRWKFKVLAHSKDWRVGELTREVVTEKTLMIKPNLPRFVREGDQIELTAQVLNLSEKLQSGNARLTIKNPLTGELLKEESVLFNVNSQSTDLVAFRFQVPESIELLQIEWKAETERYSDGEQSLLAVLPNRTEVLVSLPISVKGGGSKTVRFEELLNNNQKSLRHRLYKVELLENPQWSVLQLLSDGGAQSQSRGLLSMLYGYSTLMMSKKIVDSQPRIADVVRISQKQSKEKSVLTSNLERNEDVKNILLNETPWVVDAQSDNERILGLTNLLEANYVRQAEATYWDKIIAFQNEDGSFSWFEGMPGSLYMTSLVVSQLGHLKQLGAVEMTSKLQSLVKKALRYIDSEEDKNFKQMTQENKKNYELTTSDLHYLYLRSQFPEIAITVKNSGAYKFYLSHLSDWKQLSLRDRALAALVAHREKDEKLAQTIVSSLLEYSTQSEEKGIYWQGSAMRGYSPISMQVAMMEALHEIGCTTEQMDGMKTWLLGQKRLQSWDDEVSSMDAAYAIMLTGSDWFSEDNPVKVTIGGENWLGRNSIGYNSKRYESADITPNLGEVTIQNSGKTMVWASLYWRYSDLVTEVKNHKTDLQIEKQIWVEKLTAKGKTLEPLKKQMLKVGDKLVSRLVVRTQEDLDYVLLKDQLASCMEVGNQLSGYRFEQGVGYYRSINDASVQYFFEHLPKGTYIFELPFDVSHEGQFFAGIATLQSLYAPDYSANSSGGLIVVGE